MNSDVICAMQIMLDIHADNSFNALMNTSILLLENTCVIHTIRGIKIFMNNSPCLKNAMGSWNAKFLK